MSSALKPLSETPDNLFYYNADSKSFCFNKTVIFILRFESIAFFSTSITAAKTDSGASTYNKNFPRI